MVMIDPRLPWKTCAACISGKDYGCPHQGGIGYSRGGGLSERVAVPLSNCYYLPQSIPGEFAALIEPFAVAVHAIKKTAVRNWKSKNILVVRGGQVGLALLLVLRSYGAVSVFVSEPTSTRRKQVEEFSAVILDPMKDNVEEVCLEKAAGQGVDMVFDCAGLKLAYPMV